MTETPEKPVPGTTAAHPRRRAGRWLALVAVAGGGLVCFLSALGGSPAGNPVPAPEAMTGSGFNPFAAQSLAGDYSKFPHTNQTHSRLPCLLCHRRADNSPQPKRSGHTPCAGCHVQQFAASGGPICTICHTNVEPGHVEVKAFPPLKSFDVTFDHSRHGNVACATCHKSTKGGVALSIPAGLRAHAICYQCHAPRAQSGGRDISSCGTCHRPGTFVRAAEWTRAYRASFSHAEHGRQNLNCNECHTIRAGAKAGITAPAPTEHSGSSRAANCATCHNNRRAFGEDFTSCKKCHQGPAFKF